MAYKTEEDVLEECKQFKPGEVRYFSVDWGFDPQWLARRIERGKMFNFSFVHSELRAERTK